MEDFPPWLFKIQTKMALEGLNKHGDTDASFGNPACFGLEVTSGSVVTWQSLRFKYQTGRKACQIILFPLLLINRVSNALTIQLL